MIRKIFMNGAVFYRDRFLGLHTSWQDAFDASYG